MDPIEITAEEKLKQERLNSYNIDQKELRILMNRKIIGNDNDIVVSKNNKNVPKSLYSKPTTVD